LGGSLHTINENAEALDVASKEIGLEINAVRPSRCILKTKYVILTMNKEQQASKLR